MVEVGSLIQKMDSFVILLAVWTVAAFAQEQRSATSGNCSPIILEAASVVINCFPGDTKEGLNERHNVVLSELTSHTPIEYIVQEMGQPNMVGQLDGQVQIKVWNSIHFRLFALLRGEDIIGFGVMGDDDTKIPLLRWTNNGRLGNQILKDQTCESPDISLDARFGYFEVSGCWQGRGGGYFYYEYAFYGHNCVDDIGWDPVEFSKIVGIECVAENTPFLAIVRFDRTDEAPVPLVHLVTEFFFWTF